MNVVVAIGAAIATALFLFASPDANAQRVLYQGTLSSTIPNSCEGDGFDKTESGPGVALWGGGWKFAQSEFGNVQVTGTGENQSCSHLNGFGAEGWTAEFHETCTVIAGPQAGMSGLLSWSLPDTLTCSFDTPCESYDQNWVDTDLFGNDEFCTPLYDSDENECTNVSGYINDTQFCADDREDCEARGGTYGFFGQGQYIGAAVCIPPELYSGNPENCAPGDGVIVTGNGANDASFSCQPTTPPLSSDPTDEPYSEQDTDNDGIPDVDDPDIDGDGLNNSVDDDIDGDGIPNADDSDTDGSSGNVAGGGSCVSPPRCSGDAIQCAILNQTWNTRCAPGNQSSGGGGTGTQPDYTGLLSTIADNTGRTANALEDTTGEGPTPDDEELPTEDEDISSLIASIFNTSGAAGSCPAPITVNTMVGPIDFKYDLMCDFASYIRYLVLISAGLASFRIVMRAF